MLINIMKLIVGFLNMFLAVLLVGLVLSILQLFFGSFESLTLQLIQVLFFFVILVLTYFISKQINK